MKPYRLSTVAIGSHHLTWLRGTSNLQWRKVTKKTAFRASSTGLYNFTCMPFGLSNAGSSFCCLMEQCLGDQQVVTLLLYLYDVCIFAPTIDDMLDCIELVFNPLKQFNLKINANSLALVYCSWSCPISWGHLCKLRESGKVKTWSVTKNIKEVQSFLGLAPYYRWFIPHFAKKAWYLSELVGPTANKPKKKARARKNEIAPPKPEMKPFEWIMKHQEAFDALKEALSTALLLGYPNLTRGIYTGDRHCPVSTG